MYALAVPLSKPLALVMLLIGVVALSMTTSCESVRTVAPNPEARPASAAHPTPRSQIPTEPLASASAPVPAASTAPAPARRLYIHPLGPALPDADAEFVQRSLAAFYTMDLLLLPRSPLPRDAYYAPRSRYRAEKLLEHLQTSLPEDGFRVLGLTGHDISTTKEPYEDWGILGLATVDGEACVISTFRTKKGAKSPEHARIRLGKTAVHEIGHTLGLPHCPNQGCLMEDARGTVATTDTEYDLCPDCRAKLEAAGYPLATGTTIPWPRPGE